MAKLDKILLTTDMSDAALAAFPTAAMLAERFDAEVLVATVLDLDPQLPPGVIGLSPPREASFRAEVRSHVDNHLRALLAKYFAQSLRVQARILEGAQPAQQLCELAEQEQVDLIVTATHGRSGVVRMVLGSVAERIVRHAPCAVTLVPVPGGE